MNIAELETVKFHREHILKQPDTRDLLTLEDTDEHKLPAMDKLLRQMSCFHSELNSVGLALKVNENDQYPRENLYKLTDTGYDDFDAFKIIVKSDWLNPKWKIAIHGGFNFHLHVVQDGFGGRYEIADWINIRIQHLDTTPVTFASTREHVKTLGFFLNDQEDSYFHDIPMNYTTAVNFERIKDGLTFKTDAFIRAVDDACTVMRKIISRKQHLTVHAEQVL